MTKRPFNNRLNDLDPKSWLKFQKSWFVHNPPPRRKDVLRHPAKFPETLAKEFIEFFTKRGQVVLDPMAGTGSTLVAALHAGRVAYGIELNPAYAEIARQVVEKERLQLISAQAHSFDEPSNGRANNVNGSDGASDELNTEYGIPLTATVITGNAIDIARHVATFQIPMIDYVLTSPPYWDMLRARGAETQKTRRSTPELDVFYSDDPEDLGNMNDYQQFLEKLVQIYANLKPFLRSRAYLTIIVKNVKKGGKLYPLAWDLGRRLGEFYTLKDEKVWCQNDVRLAPYGLGNAWVSNTFHHYCLQFRNE